MTASKSRLAINGGNPVRCNPMPARAAFGEMEKQAVLDVMDFYQRRGEDPPYQGVFEQRLCDSFSKFMGGGYADAVSSGTAACFVALAALDLPKGSEVLISPVTDSGPLNSIILLGLKPVLMDSEQNSYNIGVEQFSNRITSQTSALFAVHAAGEPLDMVGLIREAKTRDIKVIEDCSQSVGALCNGKPIGGFGDIAAFSTMVRKTLMAGASGGLVYSTSERTYHSILAHADRGKQPWRSDVNQADPSLGLFPALNFNTDEISCGIGMASLNRLAQTIRKRVDFVAGLIQLLKSESEFCKPYNFHMGFSPFFFPIFIDVEKIKCTKIEFAQALVAEGIPNNVHYGCLISSWDYSRQYMMDEFATPNAANVRDRSFNLFLNENYGQDEIDDIVSAIRKVESVYKR